MSDVEGDEPMEAVAEAVAAAGKKNYAILIVFRLVQTWPILNQNLMQKSAVWDSFFHYMIHIMFYKQLIKDLCIYGPNTQIAKYIVGGTQKPL